MNFFKLSYCPCCKKISHHFIKLDDEFISRPVVEGFTHPISQWETLNWQEYSCSKCGASDRDRLMVYFLESNSKLIQQKNVLEFAPSSPVTRCLKKLKPSSYLSLDKYMFGVDLACDITDMREVPDSSVDFLICSHVLEHIQDDIKAMKELKRILKPGGVGLLLVPISLKNFDILEDSTLVTSEDRLRHFGQEDHLRIYNKVGFVSRLEMAGFKVDFYKASKKIPYFKRSIMGFSKSSCLYLVYK